MEPEMAGAASVNLFKFGISAPDDVSPLQELRKAGYDASQILAVVGKTEGNGCVNDFSRTLAAHAWAPLIPPDAITVFSGGTEGVLSPHVTFVVREPPGVHTGLVALAGHTRSLPPHEVGTAAQAREVDATIRRMLAGPRSAPTTTPEHIRLALVKCPLLTSAKIAAARVTGQSVVTTDTYESMARSRYVSALGVAMALGELGVQDVDAMAAARDPGAQHWSPTASCSSGAELEDCHILLLAVSPEPRRGTLRAVSGYMKDAMDGRAVVEMLDQVKRDAGEVVQVFAKAEADPTGSIRGHRHTMNTDSDIHSTRHARAAVGGLLAGLTGDPKLYVSGGAEGQGPPGGGSLCVVYRVPE